MPKTLPFIDQARIFIKAGNGGNGHVGFHRAKFVPKGGPDGGDGGKGGDVVLVGSEHKTTLYDLRLQRHFRAQDGQRGARNQRKGADGERVKISVPLGTIIRTEDGGSAVAEITSPHQEYILESGGRGGLGNMHFASATNQAPKKATNGETREGRWVFLELRLLADVGLVGPPNAGKSTLLSVITKAKPKIAPYPFTTLSPMLGVVSFHDTTFTLADMPGLIVKAHQGAGLGISFLRHIQRTRVLLYVVAADAQHPEQTWLDYQMIENEVLSYDPLLANRRFLVTITKMDLVSPQETGKVLEAFVQHNIHPILISAQKKRGLTTLAESLYAQL